MARDESFFDDLARGLADGTLTRGKALRLMGAAVVGARWDRLASVRHLPTLSGCKRNGKNCTRNEQCCSGNCSGGSCQAQTTTTTTTRTTTTSTTTLDLDDAWVPTGRRSCAADTLCCAGTICATAMLHPKFQHSQFQSPAPPTDECCSGICK